MYKPVAYCSLNELLIIWFTFSLGLEVLKAIKVKNDT